MNLPTGLTTTDSAAQQLGTVPVNSESEAATWQVVPDGNYCGELSYTVVATADNGWQQTVTRTVMVPATTNGYFTSGWQLMAVPFTSTTLP